MQSAIATSTVSVSPSADTFSGASLLGCRAAQAAIVSEPQLASVAFVKRGGGLRPASGRERYSHCERKC